MSEPDQTYDRGEDSGRRLTPRREADRRLDELEQEVRANTRELIAVNRRFGERNTTLISDLEEHFPTRKELQADFVTREEHASRRRGERDMLLRLSLLFFTGAQTAATLYVMIHGAHR